MSKDPFQILADELTLIRKDMDHLQRTSLDKDEAKMLNKAVIKAAAMMAQATMGPSQQRYVMRHRIMPALSHA